MKQPTRLLMVVTRLLLLMKVMKLLLNTQLKLQH
jgi:hypothetical protein